MRNGKTSKGRGARALRRLCLLLAVVVAAGVIPAAALAPASAAEPVFYGVTHLSGSSDGNTLKELLESDGDYRIVVDKDLEARIGNKGDRNAPYVDYWCTLGSGTKVIDLNGHKITLYNDRIESQKAMTMFKVPSGAELVINDTGGGSGEIFYNGLLAFTDHFSPNSHLNKHNIVEVTGGRLTVNGGKLTAGRSQKVFLTAAARYFYRQINGTAIVLTDGEAVISGGEIRGRGIMGHSYTSDDGFTGRCAAVKADGGKLTICGGQFWGMGCADAVQIAESVDASVTGGLFNVHKVDYELAIGTYETTAGSDYTAKAEASYGKIGLPREAFSGIGTKTNVFLSGTGTLSAQQVSYELMYDTSKTVRVSAVSPQAGDIQRYVSGSYRSASQWMTVEWDKTTALKLKFVHDQYYPAVRSFDEVGGYETGHTCAAVRTSPESANVFAALYAPSGSDIVDLNDLPQSSKDKLQVGASYYVRMMDWEDRGSDSVVYNDCNYFRIDIVEPDMEMPELEPGIGWESWIRSDGSNMTTISPAGEGTLDALDELLFSGKATSFTTRWKYKDRDGVQQTVTHSSGFTGELERSDFFRGISTVTYEVSLYKGRDHVLLGTASTSKKVVFFPELVTSVEPEGGMVLLDPSYSSKKVTVSCDADDYTGIFWTHDGAKISGSSGWESFEVDLAKSSDRGWYGLGYTLNGVDYYCDQALYLGLREGARHLDISSSSEICTITGDGDDTPVITASASGRWGVIRNYKWKNVSWPEGCRPATTYVNRSSSNTITLAELFMGGTGNETGLLPGVYVFSCTATDTNGNSATSHNCYVEVRRPAQGIELWHRYGEADFDEEDVTGGFIVMKGPGFNDRLRPVFAPAGSTPGSTEFSRDTICVDVNNEGFISARTSGSAIVTAAGTGDHSSLSAQAKVIVPRTEYSVSVYEDWLNANAGGEVRRGEIQVSVLDTFSAELIWYVESGIGGVFDGDTFEGETSYRPVIRIYPDEGTYYPVKETHQYGRTEYEVDLDALVLNVNGARYSGASLCGREVFFNAEPVSEGSVYNDYIDFELDPTGILINWRDEYLTSAVFSVDVPAAGQPKDVTGDGDLPTLFYTVITDGVKISGDTVRHVTDPSSVSDSDPSNDAVEDFTAYEAGETYRDRIWLVIDSSYRNDMLGRAWFADDVKAVEPELRTVSDGSSLP
ncbi:MAG: hypothetical protein II803_03355, partial [Firmicutes bacterium]|nr:hypothetical protein [Bacillota bacterium]